MKVLINSKKEIFISCIFSLLILFGIIICIPIIDYIVLNYVEIFFNKKLRDPGRWIDILQNTSRLCIFILCLIYFLKYVDIGKSLKLQINDRFIEIKNQFLSKQSIILFISLFIFLFIGYYNIITANFFFADDIFRNYGGNRSWIGFSRYISEFGSIIIHNNLKLNDIAPLTQFISIILSAITIFVLSISLTENLSIINLFTLSIIFLFPFYAENISYRFDCIYMTISIFFSSIPFLFKADKKTYTFMSIICLLLTCISYQAALPIYILSVIFIFSNDIINDRLNKTSLHFVLISICSFIFALVFFKLFFMNKINNTSDDYFSSSIKVSAIISNSINYLKQTFYLCGGLLTKGLFIFSIAIFFFKTLFTKMENKGIKTLLIFVLFLLAYILSYGPYLVFEKPVFAPRAYIGFNCFVSFVLLGSLNFFNNFKKKNSFTKVISILTSYSCIIFMFTYGNSLKNQKDYENFRTQLILSDLANDVKDSANINVCITGTIGHCKKNRIALRNYPLIKTLINVRPSQGHIWNEELLNSYNFVCTCNNVEKTDDFIIICDNIYHTIYNHENDYIVQLK